MRQHERGKTRRHLQRYREIITIFMNYGFRDLLSARHTRTVSGTQAKQAMKTADVSLEEHSRWARIRMMFEELGPTFIKLGQIMSNRPDLLPAEMLAELEKLQTGVPPFDAADAVAIIEEELGKPVKECFLHFEREPVASASIAQAHRARLVTGEQVIVKVERPNIESIIKTDIEILLRLAGLFQQLVLKSEALDPVSIIQEFGKSLNREIDFYNEAVHIEKFKSNFKGNEQIVVPQVYREFSSRRVLTMEYIDGTHVSQMELLRKKDVDTKKIADRGANLMLEQIFEHGFFHADPHPGNVMILEDEKICFLDFGMMGMILPKHRDYLSSIMIGIVNQDSEKITKALIDFSNVGSVPEFESLEYEIFELTQSYSHLPLKDINMRELLPRMLSIILDYNIKLPSNIFLLIKALITIEGVGRRLDPEFDLVSQVEPFAKRLIRNRFKADDLKKDALYAAVELRSILKNLPEDTKDILKVLKSGTTQIDFEQRGLQRLFKNLGIITNRISFSIICAALIIGSALILGMNVPPLVGGVSLLGIAGIAGAAFMGGWLLVNILRNYRR